MAKTPITTSVIDSSKQGMTIGHVVAKFRGQKFADSTMVAEALDTVNEFMKETVRSLRQEVVINVPISLDILTYTLTGATTIKTDIVASQGALLIVKLIEDATGGRTIIWDAAFKGILNTDIVTTANKTSVYLFFGDSDGLWWILCFKTGI